MDRNQRTTGRTVLLVEDEFLIRADTADVLAGEGLEVLEAADAEEALDMLATRRDIYVLFTDVNLPGMDGLQLARLVHRRWPDIRVVVTSGHADPAEIEMPGLFIGKPYRPEAVAETLRGLVN
jgi:CheY-like chemotaxis protein